MIKIKRPGYRSIQPTATVNTSIPALRAKKATPESPEKPLIVNMTFGVVAFSILVQGSTIGKLFSPAYLKNILKS